MTTAERREATCYEFDCCECGVHVYAVCLDALPEPPVCATCLHLPGWMNDPQLRAIFGRGYLDLETPSS